MHSGESENLRRCASCGAEIDPDIDRAYRLGEEVVCFECSIARGGRYSAELEQWTTTPDTGDLGGELRPHA